VSKTISKAEKQGWTLVRHVPQQHQWHQSTDQLTGDEVYGDRSNPKDPWSTKYSDKHFTEFKFSTGDGKHWMVVDKDEVYGWYGKEFMTIKSSSISSISYKKRMANST
jgi:hypothetical protein